MSAENHTSSPGPQPEAGPGTPAPLGAWMDHIRQQEAPTIPAPAPAPRPSKVVRGITVLLAVAAIGLGLVTLTAGPKPGPASPAPGTVQGRVLDADGEPLENSLVFVASAPKAQTTTDEDGTFVLRKVPAGRQSLIVVRQEIGQEFVVQIEPAAANRAGSLVYRAPPDK